MTVGGSNGTYVRFCVQERYVGAHLRMHIRGDEIDYLVRWDTVAEGIPHWISGDDSLNKILESAFKRDE